MPIIPAVVAFAGTAAGAATISAGATLAAGALAANSSSHAVNRATDATTASNDAALALQRDQYNQTRADYAPWRAVGAGALQMLARTMNVYVPKDTFSPNVEPVPSWTAPAGAAPAGGASTTRADDTFIDPRTGLAPGAGAPAGDPLATPAAPSVTTPGTSSGAAYFAANPDVKAEYDKILPNVDWNSPWAAQHGFVQGNPDAFAQWHYDNHGQAEGRTMPAGTDPVYAPVGTPTTTVPPGTTPVATTAPPVATTYTGQPVNAAGIPQGSTAGTNSRYGDFYASPDYAFRRDEGLRAVTGNYSARGLLDSGVIGKGLINYSQAAASQEFGSWYSKISALAGVGQSAVDSSATAAQANANNQSGIIRDSGAARAAGAATNGGITAGLINNIGATGAGLINNLSQPRTGYPSVSGLVTTGGGGSGLFDPVY